jgi:adenosylmethionine-8-amino-7-oxononanoate aminotransferase
MSSVFYRDPLHDYPVAVHGKGVYLYDSQGKQYLDGSGGAAISCLGYGHADVVEAINEQVSRLAFAHTTAFSNEPQERLAHTLAQRLGQGGHERARVYFLSGGSEANEAALKMARQYWLARGQPDKRLMISRLQSYHGNTLGALSLAGNPGRSRVYAPLLHDWPKVDPCYAYRHRLEGESVADYGRRSADSLEAAIDEHGAENIAAFFAETVVGATMGAVPAVRGYFQRIREICDRHEILLVLDEVMAGCGRTGVWFAFEHEGMRPDMVSIAKGLGAGYQPIGALLVGASIHDAIVDAFGAFAHGHTYIGHATATAAAQAVHDVIQRDNLLHNVRERGDELKQALEASLGEHPGVGDIRGRGLLLGIELVEDRASKKPVRAELGLPEKIRRKAMDKGLVCYPGGGTADGKDGAHILLAPPFTFESAHVEELVGKLTDTLTDLYWN